MAQAQRDLELILGANISESTTILKRDISELEKKLADKNLKVTLSANETESAKSLRKNIDNLQERLDKSKIKLSFDGRIGESVRNLKNALPAIQKHMDSSKIKISVDADIKHLLGNITQQMPSIESSLSKAFAKAIPIKFKLSPVSSVDLEGFIVKDKKKTDISLDVSEDQKQLNKKLDRLNDDFIKSGKSSQQFTDKISALRKEIGAVQSTQGIKNLKEDLADLNKELTSEVKDVPLSKISSNEKLLTKYNEKATQLGVTNIPELTQANALMAQINDRKSYTGQFYSDQITQAKELENCLADVAKQLKLVEDSANAQIRTDSLKNTLEGIKNQYPDRLKRGNLADEYKALMSEASNSGGYTGAEIDALKDKFADFELRVTKSDLKSYIKGIKEDIKTSGIEAEDYLKYLDKLQREVNKATDISAVKGIQGELFNIDLPNINKANAALQKFEDIAKKRGDSPDQFSEYESLKSAVDKINSLNNQGIDLIEDGEISAIRQFNDALLSLQNKADEIVRADALSIAMQKASAEIDKLKDKLLQLKNDYTNAFQDQTILQHYDDHIADVNGLSPDSGIQNIGEVKARLNGFEKEIKIADYQQQLKQLVQEYDDAGKSSELAAGKLDEVRKVIDDLGSSDNFKGAADGIKELKNQLKDIEPPDMHKIGKDIHNWRSDLDKFKISESKVPQLEELDELVERITSNDFSTLIKQEQVDLVDELNDKLAETRSIMQKISKSEITGNSEQASNNTLDRTRRSLEQFTEKNPRVLKDSVMLERYNQLMYQMGATSTISAKGINKLKGEVFDFETAAKRAGLTTETLGDKLVAAYQKFGGWALVVESMGAAKDTIKSMVTSVISLDTAMTELKKVTNETDESYNNFFALATDRSKVVGTTVSDYITSTADFSRLGYNLQDAQQLSEAASIYYNVADGMDSIDEASSSIISTMQAFGVETSDAMGIVDEFNHISNNFAINSSGIGEAMKRSASAMHEAGNTMEQTVALITAANTVVQDPEKVGTALKTLSLRLRGAKADLESAGESTDGMATSVSALREKLLALTGQKVDIMADANTFKSTYDILKEMSAVWDSMTDINKAAALELMGGKQQANVLASLISNFDTAENVFMEAQNAAGSAIKENEKYLDSISGRIDQFQSSFEALSASIISDDLLKGIIGGASSLLDIVNNIVSTLGTLPTVLGLISAGLVTAKNIKAFDTEPAQNLIGTLKTVKDYIIDFDASKRTAASRTQLNTDVEEYHAYIDTFKDLVKSMDESLAREKAFDESFKEGSDAVKEYAVSNEIAEKSVEKFETQQEDAIQQMEAFSLKSIATKAAVGLLTGALTSLATALIGLVINKVISYFDDLIHHQEKLLEASKALQEEVDGRNSEIDGLTSKINDISSKILELKQQGHLTFSDQEELARLTAEREELSLILKLKRQELDLKNQESTDKSIEGLENKRSYQAINRYDQTYGVIYGNKTGNILDELNAYIETVEYLEKRKSGIIADMFNLTPDDPEFTRLNTELTAVNGSLDDYNERITATSQEIITFSDGLKGNSEDVTYWKEQINKSLTDLSELRDPSTKWDNFIKENNFGSLDSDFQKMAEAGTLTEDAILSNARFVEAMNKSGFAYDDVLSHYLRMAEGINAADISPEKFEYLKDTLKDVTDQLADFSASDLKVPQLTNVAPEQTDAWNQLHEEADNLGISFEQLIDILVQLGMIAGGTIEGISGDIIGMNANTQTAAQTVERCQKGFDALAKAYKTLQSGKPLNVESVQKIAEIYPQLRRELNEYLTGLRTEQQLMKDLEAVYEEDLNNYKATIAANLQTSEEFYNAVLKNNADMVSKFNEKYHVDLNNFKTYAEAKMAILAAIGGAMDVLSGKEIINGRAVEEDINGALLVTAASRQSTVESSKSAEEAIKAINDIMLSNIDTEFEDLTGYIKSTDTAAKDTADTIRSIASSSLSAINGLVDMTVQMLKQDLEDQKDQIETDLKDLQRQHNAAKKDLQAEKKDALASLDAQKKALQQQKRDKDKEFDRERDQLNRLKKEQNKIFDDRKKAAKDELDDYNKIIDAQIKLLRLQEKQHDYEKELAEKQKEVADIEAKLTELGLDDSAEAQKKRLELEEELAEHKTELEEFQHDKDIEDQEQALQDEKDAFEEKQKDIIDGIEAEKDAYEEMIQSKLDGIKDEKDAFDESMQGQLDAIDEQKAQTQAYYDDALAAMDRNYEAEKAALEDRKKDIEDKIQDETTLKKQAVELIQGKSEEFYNRLIEWNRKYGSGIDADVILKWNNAYTALETFGGKQFDVLKVMNDLTLAGDGFTASLNKAVSEAGNLSDALQKALNKQKLIKPPHYDINKYDYITKGKDTLNSKNDTIGKFHEGGEAGKDNNIHINDFNKFMDNLESDEIPAVLKKKEWVLTEAQQHGIMDLTSEQNKVISMFDSLYKGIRDGIQLPDVSALKSIVFNGAPSLPDIDSTDKSGGNMSIYLSTEITGNADDDVMDRWLDKNIATLKDTFSRYTLNEVNYRRGLRTVR